MDGSHLCVVADCLGRTVEKLRGQQSVFIAYKAEVSEFMLSAVESQPNYLGTQ